ncbi:MAG: ABC transporter permease [Streptosporangiaceae bacterium]
MTAPTARVAFAKIVLAEARIAWRTPVALIFGVGLPTLLVVIFGETPKSHVHNSSLGGLTRFSVELPVLIAFVIAAMALYSLPVPLATYREQGILRRLSVTPARPSWVLAAQVAINLVLALAGLAIILVLGTAAFGETAPKSMGGFILAVALSLAAVFAIGLAIAALARTAGGAHALGVGLFVPLMFLAGLWFPRQEMTAWLRDVSNYSPLGAASQATQDAIGGTFPAAALLLTLAGYAAVFGFVAARYFRWE